MTIDATLANIFGEFLPSIAQDVVGVYDQNFVQVFPKARPMKATVKEDSKLMEHPLETGSTVVDHRIILPIEIELAMLLPNGEYRNIYEQIKQIYLAGTLLIVQTKTASYSNMLIQSLPHEEDPAMYDAVPVGLKLREVQFATTTVTIVPKNPVNVSTLDRGTQPANDVTGNQRNTVLNNWFGGFFK